MVTVGSHNCWGAHNCCRTFGALGTAAFLEGILSLRRERAGGAGGWGSTECRDDAGSFINTPFQARSADPGLLIRFFACGALTRGLRTQRTQLYRPCVPAAAT